MGSDEIKLILMTVGVTLSAVGLFFAIRNRIIDKRRGLSISHTVQAMLDINGDYLGLVLRIYLRNSGNVNLFIHRPYIKLPYKLNGYDQYQLVSGQDTTNYPVKLEPSEECSVQVGYADFFDHFASLKWYRRVSFEARDTSGKVYKSKKTWFKYFIKQNGLEKNCQKVHNKVINLAFWATLRSVHSLRSLLHSTTLHPKCRL